MFLFHTHTTPSSLPPSFTEVESHFIRGENPVLPPEGYEVMGLPTEEAEKVFKRVKRNYEGDGKFVVSSLPPSLLPSLPASFSLLSFLCSPPSANSHTQTLPPLPPFPGAAATGEGGEGEDLGASLIVRRKEPLHDMIYGKAEDIAGTPSLPPSFPPPLPPSLPPSIVLLLRPLVLVRIPPALK